MTPELQTDRSATQPRPRITSAPPASSPGPASAPSHKNGGGQRSRRPKTEWEAYLKRPDTRELIARQFCQNLGLTWDRVSTISRG